MSSELPVPPGPSVVVELTGGLANQMFQYAAGYALARNRKCPLMLDARKAMAPGGRGYQLLHLGVGEDVVASSASRLEAFLHGSNSVLTRLIERRHARRHYRIPDEITIFRPSSFGYDASIWEAPGSVYLQGHFQSPDYFRAYGDDVRNIFMQRAQMAPSLAPSPSQGPQVALHVRRGDYLHKMNAATHGVLDQQYYETALQVMQEEVGSFKLHVFSDDPAWAQRIFHDRAQVWPTGRPEADLLTMAQADAHIIANSSYSWWAAWLANSSLVVAPRKWFADESIITRDLLPQQWIRV